MASIGLRDQDKLDGTSNFDVWKSKILLLLEKDKLKEYATTVVAIPTNQV